MDQIEETKYIELDYKYSIWERLFIPEKYKDKVLKILKKGGTANDVYTELGPYILNETLDETSEELEPFDNEGNATIKLSINDKIIYKNGKYN